MDLLEQCELDDEKLMGKTSRQRGVKVKLYLKRQQARKANYSFLHNWHQSKLICACHFRVCFSSLTTHEPTALNDLMDRQTPRGAL